LDLQYYGIQNQSYFALTEYQNGALNGTLAKLWGNTVDMGGATNSVRPQFLTLSLVKQSLIGPMYSCPIDKNAAFNFTGESNNGAAVPPGSPALNNVPLLYAFCFVNGTQRSIVLINTDLTTSHALSFAGTNPPAGTVTVRQYAPPSLDSMNESPSGTSSYTSQATVALSTSRVTNPGSLTLPPYSVTALDWNVPLAGPTFSLATGTYSPTQTMTLTDAVSGAAIYYTTDGSTPTSSSTQSAAPLTVSTTETVSAIAVYGGLTSAPSTATYTIANPPASPAFSIPAGTYSNGQTFSLSDATSNTTPRSTSTKSSNASQTTPSAGSTTCCPGTWPYTHHRNSHSLSTHTALCGYITLTPTHNNGQHHTLTD
jgi:hypothetical protein